MPPVSAGDAVFDIPPTADLEVEPEMDLRGMEEESVVSLVSGEGGLREGIVPSPVLVGSGEIDEEILQGEIEEGLWEADAAAKRVALQKVGTPKPRMTSADWSAPRKPTADGYVF